MAEVQQRRRGRPPGSKNKKTNLSGATIERICEYHRFNPAEKLIAIANGTDKTAPWTKDDQLKATTKLFDAVHMKRGLPGGVSDDDQPHNYEIVFVEGDSGFELPREGSAAGDTGTVRPEQNERLGLPS